jgi:hypothetical protein
MAVIISRPADVRAFISRLIRSGTRAADEPEGRCVTAEWSGVRVAVR